MKKLLFCLLLFTYCCHAQNYDCLQVGVKRYFTNGNGYLRGIRIDSIHSYPDSVIYFPFHTPRGRWFIGLGGANTYLDSNGGSWLGKKVIKRSDGTFLFDSFWGDTVVVRTQAAMGETWIFRDDTSPRYYKATVVGMDTMTFLGILDSVKRIRVTAHNASGIVPTDPVHNFEMVLSKNHGFAEVFDLYTFPYHKPDTAWTRDLDFYMDHATSSSYAFTDYQFVSDTPDANNSIFRPVDFLNPTTNQLFQVNVGDVTESGHILGWAPPISAYYLDTIVSKTVLAHSVVYNYSGLEAHYNYPSGPGYTVTYRSGSFTADDSTYLFDTTKMPEEKGSQLCNYYFPDDSSFCVKSALYRTGWVYSQDGRVSYKKIGFGPLREVWATGDPSFWDDKVIYSYRSGIACGNYAALGVVNMPSANGALEVFPNPAMSVLSIVAEAAIDDIVITDMLGRNIRYAGDGNKRKDIDISSLVPGVYFIRVNNDVVKKFVKQ